VQQQQHAEIISDKLKNCKVARDPPGPRHSTGPSFLSRAMSLPGVPYAGLQQPVRQHGNSLLPFSQVLLRCAIVAFSERNTTTATQACFNLWYSIETQRVDSLDDPGLEPLPPGFQNVNTDETNP
jgi:hypothetical protein